MVKGLDWGWMGLKQVRQSRKEGDGEGIEKKYKSGTGNWEKFSYSAHKPTQTSQVY